MGQGDGSWVLLILKKSGGSGEADCFTANCESPSTSLAACKKTPKFSSWEAGQLECQLSS